MPVSIGFMPNGWICAWPLHVVPVAFGSTGGEGEGQEPVVVPDDQGIAGSEQAARPDAEGQERGTAALRFPDPQVAVGSAGCHYGDAIACSRQYGGPGDLAVCRIGAAAGR